MKQWCSIAIAGLVCHGTLMAQEQVTDTLRTVEPVVATPQTGGLSQQDIDELTRPLTPGNATPGTEGSDLTGLRPISASDIELQPALDPNAYRVPRFDYSPARGSYLPQWQGGGMWGSSSQSGNILWGYTNSASMGIYQQMGDWTAMGGLQLTKYGVMYNTATLTGQLSWRPSRNFGVTVFGNYMPGTFMSPINLGPSWNYGGYVTLQSNGMLGIDLGAQTYYDPIGGHQVTPIVMPYLNINGAKLGIDLGPLIQDALQRNNRHGGGGGGFNPIPQPIKAIPVVR